MKPRSTVGWLDLLRGILFIALGIAAICAPGLALSGLVVLFGAAAVLSGVFDLILYTKVRKRIGFASKGALVSGIVGILAGLLLFLRPVIGRWILNIVFPIWIIAHCVSRIAGYGFMKRLAGKALSIAMVCLNVAGLLFSVLMIFNPMLFTMSFGILIAVSIILLGVSSIVEAFSGGGAPDVRD